MKKYRILTVGFVLVGIFSLQSCFVAKEYNRPQEITTEAYYRTDELVKDSTTIAKVSWKEVFTDASLQSLIDKGLSNNLDIRNAMQNIRIAEAYMKQGRAQYFPTFSVGPKFTLTESSANSSMGRFTGKQTQRQYELSGAMSWELDIWGRIKSNQRATEATFLQTLAAHQAVKTSIISMIANAYYQLLALDEQKKIAQEAIVNRTQSLETTKALKDAGQVTEVAVNQTEAQLLSAESLLLDINRQIRLQENYISYILGESSTEINRSSLDSQVINTTLAIGVPAQILENRPDVKAAEFGLANAFHLVNAAEANFYPRLTIDASGGVQGIELDKLFDHQSLFANVLAGLTQPILNRRQIKTQKEVALVQQEQALLKYKQAILLASKEVSDAMYQYDAASKKIDLKQQESTVLKSAVSNSEELLNYGMANYLEVITARDSALNADLGLVKIKLAKLQSLVELYRALGGGVQ